MQKILIVEDDRRLSKLVADYLNAIGYETATADTGKQALEQVEAFGPDLMLLDVLLPGFDGHDVIRRVRGNQSNLPIIMLTARAEEGDKLIGFELGADDYITKPFSLKELAARIRAVLRRSGVTPLEKSLKSTILKAGDLVLDSEKRKVTKGGQLVPLTAVQFDILHLLMNHPGRVFSRQDILDSIQDIVYEGYERTVDVHIKNIRRTLEENPSQPQYVKTRWGVGYAFNDEL